MAPAGRCPFGGTPGAPRLLRPFTSPTARGFRVLPGAVWWRLIFWPWRQYLVAASAAIPNVRPPTLAPLGAPSVFFTDGESLQGIQDPAQFARRVGLSLQAQTECQRFGCAVVEFDVPDQVLVPAPYPGSDQGITPGGGREWMTMKNIELNETMGVTYIDVTRSGPRWFSLPL